MTSIPLVVCREACNQASTDTLQMQTGKRPDTPHLGDGRGNYTMIPLQESTPTHIRYDSMCMRSKR